MSRRVLIVDDDRNMVKTLRDLLRLHEWEADGAFSGQEALAAVRTQRYAAVLMDIKMPGLNGVETLKGMRAEQPEIQVLLMTAYATRELIVEAEEQGAVRILPKPVALETLLQSLELTLRRPRPVLIVDDDALFRQRLSDGLRQRGFVTAAATTIQDAVRGLQGEAPVAVLLHLRVENREPRELVSAIRQVSPGIAIILYSAHVAALDQTAATVPRDWVFAQLQKPFAVERLTALLDELLAPPALSGPADRGT